jgi:hypothetical protein
VSQFNGLVWVKLFACEAKKLARGDAIASEIAVQTMGHGIAWLARIADENTAATTTQDQRGAEARRSGAHDDDIKHSFAHFSFWSAVTCHRFSSVKFRNKKAATGRSRPKW